MKTLLSLLLFCFCLTTVKAQTIEREVISSSGQESEQMSWTVGETVATEVEEGDVTLTQGYQQGYYSISQKIEESVHNVHIEVYPNPVRENLYVNIPLSEKSYSIEMYDAKGSKVFEQEDVYHLVQIKMKHYPISTYYLKVLENKKLISTYKLIRKR